MADKSAAALAAAKFKKNAQGECVRVVVRCRPLNTKEINEGRTRVLDMDVKMGQITVRNPKSELQEPPKTFTFDQVYDWGCKQRDIFDTAAKPVIESCMEGYNGTVFCYGQTGTGKTFTMEGVDDKEELRGIIPNTFRHVFDLIKQSSDREHLVRASFLEIYNEDIRDLLAKNPDNRLDLHESPDTGVYVKGLTSFVVKGVNEINNVLMVGKKNRTVGATLMNQDSSRSHSIFTITIETSDRGSEDGGHIRMGKLNLVDLAGSERQSKTGATGDRLKEATKINLSLSALGNVINALVESKSGHIPYRDSKLTRLLQDSLGGNTKTVMVANLGPADYNYDETLSTLRYANRAKNIKNKPKINEDPKDAMLREFQEEIARLKAALGPSGGGGGTTGGGSGGRGVVSQSDLDAIKEQMRSELVHSMRASVDEEALRKVKADVEAEATAKMKKMLEEKERTAAEKVKIVEAIEQQKQLVQQQVEEERTARAEEERRRRELEAKLSAMESKLLHGGENLLVKTEQQQEALARLAAEQEEAKLFEEEQARRILELEEEQLTKEEAYATVTDEVEQKTKKLKKLFAKYTAAKTEISDMNEEFQREREDMLDSIRTLTQQLKLKNLILESFVPPDEEQKILRRAQWNNDAEEWQLEGLAYAGNHRAGARRPVSAVSGNKRAVSQYAATAAAMGDTNPRYRPENILNLELDLPERTTYDYDSGSAGHPRVQQALDMAFGDVGQVSLAATSNANVYFSYAGQGGGDDDGGAGGNGHDDGGGRPKSAARRKPQGGDAGIYGATAGGGGRPPVPRPRTAKGAAPARADYVGGGEEDYPPASHPAEVPEEAYPQARGLVKSSSMRRSANFS